MRRRSRALDYALYVLVRIVVCIVQALSWDRALQFAGLLGWLMHRFNRRHRLVALENLRRAFPELTDAARDELVRRCYHHFALMIIELMRLPRALHRETLSKHIDFATDGQRDHALQLLHGEEPYIVLTGHFGNWEIMSQALGLLGGYGGVVTRRLDNPYLDRLVRGFRRRSGLVMLDKTGDARRIVRFLAEGSGLGVVGDQDAGPRGLFVDFFGRPASTFKAIAQLSLEHQARIAVMATARVGNPMRYRLYLEDVIDPRDYAGNPQAARAITERFTRALERMIRRHPEQYLWLHRRWKHQPAEQRQAA